MARRYTRHARDRMRQRRVTRRDIRLVLRYGNYFIQAHGTRRYARTYTSRSGRRYRVVVITDNTNYHNAEIITTWWNRL
jgi:hypothetical protein